MMEEKRSVGLTIISVSDFILAGLFIFCPIIVFLMLYQDTYGSGSVWAYFVLFYLFIFYLPMALWLIMSNILLIKRKRISIPLHILFYSFLCFIGVLNSLYLGYGVRIPALSWLYEIDLWRFFLISSMSPFWICMRIILSALMPMLVSIAIVIYFIRPKVKEQFRPEKCPIPVSTVDKRGGGVKNIYPILNGILFGVGILTFFYLFLSWRNNYIWISLGEGMSMFVLLIPITVLYGLSCLIGAIISSHIYKGKAKLFAPISHIILAIVWLTFLHALSLGMQNDLREKPEVDLLDRKTKVGEILPDTKWVGLNHRIFYISDDTQFHQGALCSIEANGNNRRKIIDNCENYGWFPNGKDMFALCDNTLYLLKNSGDIQERVLSFGHYYKTFGKKPFEQRQRRSHLGVIQWSPKIDKFVFDECDEDTNGDGEIGWPDRPNVYIFDLTTKTKHKINFDRDVHRVDEFLWNKSGDMLYFIYCKIYSPNDLRLYLCSYDLNTNEILQLKETDYENKVGFTIEDLIGKENIFDHVKEWTYIYSLSVSAVSGRRLEPRKGIKLSTDKFEGSLYIQRDNQPQKKIFEFVDSTFIGDLYWLPGDRYIICNIWANLCIIDTESERIGILTKGYRPAWYNFRR